MSIVIKGMEMPDICEKCMFCKWSNLNQTGACVLNDWKLTGEEFSRDYLVKRPDWCPLVELPAKHGDLIDVKELEKAVLKWMPHDPCGIEERERPFETDICVSLMMEIEEQPIILEAEGKDHDHN